MEITEKQRIDFMRQALSLAARGTAAVAPNPRVGAVIVKDGKIIGRGYHRKFGGPHAEIEALSDCHKRHNDPHNATMFVTLEPCCHYGKTGPCTLAIANAGIKMVEIATLDDFAQVNGQGAAWLRQHGIIVRVGTCELQARRLNTGFFKLHNKHQPQVILKWAQSIDAYLSWPERLSDAVETDIVDNSADRDNRWITGEKSRLHVHKLRRNCGAILVGIGTVLADDPLLNVRLPGRNPQPVRIVLDTHLRINPAARLVQTAKHQKLIICTLTDSDYYRLYSCYTNTNISANSYSDNSANNYTDRTANSTSNNYCDDGCLNRGGQSRILPYIMTPESRLQKMQMLRRCGCEILQLPVDNQNNRISLVDLLNTLADAGITDLLVEGGPTVLSAFLQQNLADKLMVYVAPVIIAGGNIVSDTFSVVNNAKTINSCARLCFVSAVNHIYDAQTTKLGNDILIEGYISALSELKKL